MQHFTPLSGFDMKNCHKFTINSIPKVNKDKKERTITPSIFAKRNFNSNDYLELRKTMNNFKINELQNLKNSLNKSTNQSISKIHMTKDDEISGKSFKNEEINMNKTLNHAFLNILQYLLYQWYPLWKSEELCFLQQVGGLLHQSRQWPLHILCVFLEICFRSLLFTGLPERFFYGERIKNTLESSLHFALKKGKRVEES